MRPSVSGNQFSDAMMARLEALAPDQRAEVQDFIDFLLSKKLHGEDVKTAMTASQSACARYWDNEEDAEYDKL